VVQCCVAYTAGAWGLHHGAQFLAEIFYWPGRVLQLGTVAAPVDRFAAVRQPQVEPR